MGDRVVASSRLHDERSQDERAAFQVLTFRDGRIVDIQGCRTHREAMRFARSSRR